MRVDLFKNDRYKTQSNRLTRQIETRKCNLSNKSVLRDLENLRFDYVPKDIVNGYQSMIYDLVRKEREYSKVTAVVCDSHFQLEALGICDYSGNYVGILDFSDKLDFILHCLSGCSQAEIRAIPEYKKISKAIINLTFGETKGITFGCLFNISQKLDQYFAKKLLEIEEEYPYHLRESHFIYAILEDILAILARIRDYTIVFASYKVSKMIYRSKSLSSAVVAVNNRDLEKVTFELCYKEDISEMCEIKFQIYQPFEYAIKGVSDYELSRYRGF